MRQPREIKRFIGAQQLYPTVVGFFSRCCVSVASV